MSASMSYLQAKREAVESIGEKLTPEYLNKASKLDLEKDRDEVDKIVKSHHEMYDSTDWASEPPALIIGYETLKERIGTLRDGALRKINDQINKLEVKAAPTQDGSKSNQNNGAQGGRNVPGSESNANNGAQQGSGVAAKENHSVPATEGKSNATTELDNTVAKLLKELGDLKDDIKRVREEAVAKESLANQKIQGLETKLTRGIREAVPTTSRDEAEFTPQKSTETESQKIARLLEEIKKKVESGTKFRAKLNLPGLLHLERKKLVEQKNTVALRIAEFQEKVKNVEALKLSTDDKTRLDFFKQEGTDLEKYFNTTYSTAIDARAAMDSILKPDGFKQENDPEPSGSQTQPDDSNGEFLTTDDDDKTDEFICAPPKPPRRKDTTNPIPGPYVPENLVTAPLKLETISLPIFNGDLTEWAAFRDLFTYLIHNNNQLSNIVKFHQLRSRLRGPALDTIQGYQLTGVNYEAAWDDLQRRYDRSDNLIQEYIRKFLEVPAILHRANSHRIRAIIDATNQMIRALPGLGADVNHWDPFICLIITSKLDEETRSEWRQHVGRRTNTTLTEFIEFLETRAIDYQPSQGDRLSQMLRNQVIQRNPRRNIFAVTNEPTEKPKQKRQCVICKGDHYPWQCSKLRKECARVRAELVNSVGACVKCLLKHEVGACTKSDCPYCGEGHNSLLCLKKERETPRAQRKETKKSTPGMKDRSEKSGNHANTDSWSKNE